RGAGRGRRSLAVSIHSRRTISTLARPAAHAMQNRYNQRLRGSRCLRIRGNVMEHHLGHTISLLSHTPAALNALLRDLPEAWTRQNEGETTMTAFDVVGHLIHGERVNWIPRARMVLQFGETQ